MSRHILTDILDLVFQQANGTRFGCSLPSENIPFPVFDESATYPSTGSPSDNLVVGEILIVHVQDDLLADGVIRAERVRTIGRLLENCYCGTQDLLEMKRPLIPSSGSGA